jgi:hypothetical protein
VLLDSGASANFVSSDLVHDLSLPIVTISSPVTVRVADGRTSVVKNSVTADLSVGTMHCNGLLPYCVVVIIYGSLATCRPFQPGFVSLYRCVLSRGRYGTLSGSIPNLPESKAFWVVPPYIQAFRLVTGFVISILSVSYLFPSLQWVL